MSNTTTRFGQEATYDWGGVDVRYKGSVGEVSVNLIGLKDAIAIFNAMPQQAEQALKKATVKVAKWASNESARRVAKATKITARVVKNRVRMYIHNDFARVFVGLDPIAMKYLGPTQTPGGVRAGRYYRPHAFISEKLGGHVYERVGKARLPIKKSTVDLEGQGARQAILSIAKEIEPRLLKEFERNLSFSKFKSQL